MTKSKALISQAEYARRRGVNRVQITKMKKKGLLDGAIVKRGNRVLIDPDRADVLLEQNLDPVEKIETITRADIPVDCTFNEARTLNERWKAALNKLSFEEKSGDLIPKELHEKVAFESSRRIRDALLQIPDRIAALVAVESDQFECRRVIKTEIDHILRGLADAFRIL